MKKLDDRLMSVISLIDKNKSVADIGSDHAYIPLYLITNNICNNVLVTDIKSGPLESAKKNFIKYGLDDRLKILLYDGIREDIPENYQVIVIAGMGGLTICDILKNAKEQLQLNKNTLILQPMTEQENLRKYLNSIGYKIVNEIISVVGNTKFYNIIKAEYMKVDIYTEAEYYFGKYEICSDKEKYIALMNKKIEALKKAVNNGAIDKEDLLSSLELYRRNI